MINLIRKNVLLVKQTSLILVLLAMGLPLFFYLAGGGLILPSGIALSSITILLAMIYFASLDEEEAKYPSVKALLTAVGYSKKTQVLSRYALAYAIYALCLIIYGVETALFPALGRLEFSGVFVSLFAFSFVASLYLWLTTKFGMRTGRYLVMAVILFFSVGPSIISSFKIKINFNVLRDMNKNTLFLILVLLSAVMFSLSLLSSIKVYQNQEL